MSQLAAIRVRGVNRISHTMERTLQQLHLYRKNFCVVVPDTLSFRGMLAKVKDYITYGLIDDSTHKALIEKKGEKYNGLEEDKKGKITYDTRYIEIDNKKYKPFFRLQPPRGGFERKGTKKAFAVGGALGFRGENMKKLLERMM